MPGIETDHTHACERALADIHSQYAALKHTLTPAEQRVQEFSLDILVMMHRYRAACAEQGVDQAEALSDVWHAFGCASASSLISTGLSGADLIHCATVMAGRLSLPINKVINGDTEGMIASSSQTSEVGHA